MQLEAKTFIPSDRTTTQTPVFLPGQPCSREWLQRSFCSAGVQKRKRCAEVFLIAANGWRNRTTVKKTRKPGTEAINSNAGCAGNDNLQKQLENY